MAMTTVNAVQGNPDNKKSALDNAATVLGVLSSAGNAASSGYNSFVNQPKTIMAQQTANTNNANQLAFQKQMAPSAQIK